MTERQWIRPGDGDYRHGTASGYSYLGCRCAACHEAHKTDRLQRTEDPAWWGHGTGHGYTSGCRCDRCTEAHRVLAKEYRARRRES